MSSRKRRIEALQKRADHLAARIASSEKLELTFDKQELGALKWAIRELSAHRAEPDASDAKDAARYRHMRNSAVFQDRNGPGLYWYLPRLNPDLPIGKRLDAAIDSQLPHNGEGKT